MQVFLTTALDKPWSRELLAQVEGIARSDRWGEHTLCPDAASADIILFLDAHQLLADWSMRTLRTHPYVREYGEKAFVYDERDEPRDALPGVYVSMPRTHFDQRRHRAVAYSRLMTDTRDVSAAEPDLLFSFQGRCRGSVRFEVLQLRHPRAVLEDTSQYDFFTSADPALADARARYRGLFGRSKFVLCPRGAGTTSFRLFEALACGRVPVILSDHWVEPRGVDWTACAVRVEERDVRRIPRLLAEREPDWLVMSRAARAAYDEWFAPEVWFHRVTQQCAELREEGVPGLRRQWATTEYWRSGARHWKRTRLARSTR